jgi:hypothetical protein
MKECWNDGEIHYTGGARACVPVALFSLFHYSNIPLFQWFPTFDL